MGINSNYNEMKTLRFFEMALLLVSCAVNFTACSDDENEKSASDGINPQKVFVNGIPKQVSDMKITQDASGLVSKIETDDAVAVFQYPTTTTRAELANKHIEMMVTKDVGTQYEETFVFDMTIGNNGFIQHCDETEEDGDLETWDFTYSEEGNLTSMKRSEGGNETTTITYENSDIVKISTASEDEPTVASTYTIDYVSNTMNTPIENKGCIMLYDKTLGIDMDEMDFAFYAGLLGKATKHLPIKLTYKSDSYEDITNFVWTLNANNFPTSLSIQSESGYNDNIPIVW